MSKNFLQVETGASSRSRRNRTQWAWLAAGALLALTGGGFKAHDVLTSPAIFEYVFFSGFTYILLIAGLALIVLGLGHDLLFMPDHSEEGSSGR